MRIDQNNYTHRNISTFTAVVVSLFYLFQRATAQSLVPSHSMGLNTSCTPTFQDSLYSFNTIDPLFDYISFEEFQKIDPNATLLQNENFRSSRQSDLIATSRSGAINSLSRRDKRNYKKNPSNEKVQKLIQENFGLHFKKGLHREISIIESQKSYDITIGTTYILKESQNPDTYYGKLTGDNQLAYARHWGLNGRIVTENLLKEKCTLENGTVTDCVPYWNKIELLRDWLRQPADPGKEQWYVILDHDMVITNMNVNPYEQLQLLRKGHNTSIIVGKCSAQSKEEQAFACWKDGDPELSIGTGIMFVRKGEDTKKFFDRVWEKRNDPTGSKNSICSTLGTCQTQEFLHEQEAFARVLAEDRSLLNTVVTTVRREIYQGKQLALDSGKREGCFILINPRQGESDDFLGFDYDNVHPETIWKAGDWIGHTPGLPVKALDCETKEPVYFRETYLKALLKATIPIDTPYSLSSALSSTKTTSRHKDPVWIDLLSKVPSTSQEYALIDAARIDDVSSVEKLLKTGSISEQYRVWGILAASSNGSIKSLDLLLTSGDRIADDNRGAAMIRAAEKGHKDILARLFEGGNIFSHYLYEIVKRAAMNGHTDALDFLLSNKVISKQYLGLIVVETSKTFRSDVIEILLDYATIYGLSDNHRGLALWEASMRGCTTTAKMLLENGPISDIYRKMATDTAVNNEHIKIVELLRT